MNNILKEMDKKTKLSLLKIIISLCLFIVGMLTRQILSVSLLCYTLSYIILGTDIIIEAFKSVMKKNILDENLLMFIATIGAFLLGAYSEGVAVVLFYQIGEFFNSYAVEKSRRSVEQIVKIRPDYANLMVDGRPEKKSPKDINIGDTIMIKPGERVPLDCVVLDGNSSMDNSALTGESLPITAKHGTQLFSGCINLTGTLLAEVTSEYDRSTVSRILELVENASEKKSHTEKFITKFAKYYTPTIIISALIISILPPILISGSKFAPWIYRALVFLVISCPCALVISIPLSFFCGIGLASKKGILIKGSNYIEGLATADTVVFDKTGTLTTGVFSIIKIVSVGISKDTFLELASYAEIHSSHPIALSIKKLFDKELDESRVGDSEDISGHGVKTIVDEKVVHLGSIKLMRDIGINPPQVHQTNKIGSVIYMAVDNEYCGYAVVSDKIKDEALPSVKSLYDMGITRTAMLTGDSKEIGETIAHDLGMQYVATELLPEDKSKEIKKLVNSSKNTGTLIFVGDGINDAPVLASADVGIAMGYKGADVAVETADVVIMDDNLTKIAKAISISKFTMNVVKQNIAISLGIKFSVLLFGFFGLSGIAEAIFADVGVSAIVILNSLRILKK